MNEAVSEAAARLERAVGRLAEAVAKPRPPAEPAAPAGIPPEQVAALAERLDISLSRLRGVLVELETPQADDPDAGEMHADSAAVDEDGLPAGPAPTAAHPEEER